MKINVVGTSGTGKSTFSQRLAKQLDIPYVEMDRVFWGPNWAWPSDEVFFANLRSAISGESWVLDGNYSRSLPIRWEHVEVVVWLDYSFPRTLFQAVKRAIQRSLSQEEIWEGTGNRESFAKSFFSKDSIILWTIKTHKKVRLKYETYLRDEKYAHIKFVRLRKHQEAEVFLERIKQDPASLYSGIS